VLGAGLLAGAVMLDPAIHHATHANPSSDLGSWGQSMANVGGGAYTLPLIAAFGVAGIFGNSRERDTAFLLAESAVSAGLWTTALKEVSRRTRPRETVESDGDWNGPAAVFAEDPVDSHALQSFPSATRAEPGRSPPSWRISIRRTTWSL
jgi:hypothetical protein